jgi:putative GTP pyrophosphokinase
LTRQLKEAADIVAELDRRMERLNEEINILKENDAADNAGDLLLNPRELILQILQGGWMSEGL